MSIKGTQYIVIFFINCTIYSFYTHFIHNYRVSKYRSNMSDLGQFYGNNFPLF